MKNPLYVHKICLGKVGTMSKNVKQDSSEKIGMYVFYIFLAIIVFFNVRGAFADPRLAIGLVRERGYTDIRVVDKNWLFISLRGCGRIDAARVVLNAKDEDDKERRIITCLAWPVKTGYIRRDTVIKGGEDGQ